LTTTQLAPGHIALTCRVTDGKAYRLRRASSLVFGATWTALPVHSATGNALTLTDQVPATGSEWFYRVEEVPP